MKKFIEEFKKFIARGNVMDMAVGVIIGGAFKSIVDSLVNDIINPFLGIFGGLNFSEYTLKLSGEASLNYGNFITTIINFLVMALVIFSIMKVMNGMAAKMTPKKEEEAPAAPTTKKCPYCMSEIAIEATRCPHCTSVLEEAKVEE
ncbi:MAG: large conductance mechanosensitive channel protein MscL [Tyzzerella sp.]|nr:large conductance mechanosensitive channel protein MscL [Tyzzerella sp.]